VSEPMRELVAVHDVILRADLPAREREMLSHFTLKLVAAHTSGEDLLCLPCISIDASHPFYLRVETFVPGDSDAMTVHIPHHYVFLISGAEARRSIGFTA